MLVLRYLFGVRLLLSIARFHSISLTYSSIHASATAVALLVHYACLSGRTNCSTFLYLRLFAIFS